MTKATFRDENTAPWKPVPGNKAPDQDPMHGEAKSGKHSSAGKESQLRKEATHSEQEARAKHKSQDTKDHPALKGNTTRG